MAVVIKKAAMELAGQEEMVVVEREETHIIMITVHMGEPELPIEEVVAEVVVTLSEAATVVLELSLLDI